MTIRYCPNCNCDLQGDPIPEEHRESYGGHTHFSRIIGIEDPKIYDGISWWKCPDCGHVWDRDFGEKGESK